MEVNRIINNLQNLKNTIEIPDREYNFSNMLNLFKKKESISAKVADEQQTIINTNKKQEDKVEKPTIINTNKKQEDKLEKPTIINTNKKQEDKLEKHTNSHITLNSNKNIKTDLNKCTSSDGLTDDQYLREMFGGLAQELEGFGPGCKDFIPIFKELSAPPVVENPVSEEADATHEDIVPIFNEPNIPPDNEVKEVHMFTYSEIKNFWVDKCKI